MLFRNCSSWCLRSLIAAALLIAIAVIMPPLLRRHSLGPDASNQVRHSLMEIALAMHKYADGHDGVFPPPAIYSSDGRPLLSWRVLILPYLDQEELFKEFHLDEAWNSQHNLTLVPKMPPLFDSCYYHESDGHGATFRIFVGPGAAFEGRQGVSFKDFADGAERTLLIVEAAEPVPWTKPAELPYAPEGALPMLGRRFPNKFCVAYADGHVEWIPRTVSESALRGAITRNGREPWEPIAP